MIISFTPKNIIVDIDCDDFLNHSFKIGDNLSIVKEWVNKKNHNIYYEINRY